MWQSASEARVAERVRELAARYRPPDFGHVPNPNPGLFLCAIDHGTGYRGRYLVEGRGPFEGSALLWELGCREERRRPGRLSAAGLRDVGADEVASLLRIGGETVTGAEERARLWRDLARGLDRDHGGEADALLAASGGRLAGSGGLLGLLARYEAFADPLAKKSFLFAKIAERRRWLDVCDPEHWEVCADSVLMRLALRSGLVDPRRAEQGVEELRAATRAAFKRVAAESGVSPPLLDDLLWELGRDDPDLLGAPAGELHEPPREPDAHWY